MVPKKTNDATPIEEEEPSPPNMWEFHVILGKEVDGMLLNVGMVYLEERERKKIEGETGKGEVIEGKEMMLKF